MFGYLSMKSSLECTLTLSECNRHTTDAVVICLSCTSSLTHIQRRTMLNFCFSVSLQSPNPSVYLCEPASVRLMP